MKVAFEHGINMCVPFRRSVDTEFLTGPFVGLILPKATQQETPSWKCAFAIHEMPFVSRLIIDFTGAA